MSRFHLPAPAARCVPAGAVRAFRAAAVAITTAVFAVVPAGAQEPGEGAWNHPRALELVEAARGVRQASAVDTTLLSYRARAQGFVYFYLDRPDREEASLIRADQIALDVYWRAPGEVRQRIVGMRDQEVLPTNINYHLDHLTVVHDDFGDLIRMGDGDEVASVIHPVAPGAETLYDYRLVDSLSLSYPGLAAPVLVYQLQVRPRDTGRAGFVGTLYLDRATGAIVRMGFTFTPASYVDPHLDYIRVSLENALWMGRHWLPRRQEVELRRELPRLDFLAGSIIRGRWEVGSYDFNGEVPAFVFAGPPVTSAAVSVREAFPFQDGLYSDLEAEGLAPSPSLEDIRSEVRRMALGSALAGLPGLRLHLSSFSDAIRRTRAEGWRLGAGVAVRPAGHAVRVRGGYATSAERMWADAGTGWRAGQGELRLEGYWNRLGDLSPDAGTSGLVNTLATLGGTDYVDPYWVRGGAVQMAHPTGVGPLGTTLTVSLTGRLEDHRSAALVVDDDNTRFRPVRPVDPGRFAAATLAVRAEPGDHGGAFGDARLTVGHLEDRFLRLDGYVGWRRASPWSAWQGSARVQGGWVSSRAPLQELYLLGGRGTLPGFSFRDAVADRYLLSRAWLRRAVAPPWVAVRATGAAGWSVLDGRTFPVDWTGDPDPGVRGSLGGGLDLLWDVLQLDLARGFPDGEWSVFFSLTHRFHPWL
ncbi:MAG: hypothetical protein RQ751_04970 [Longimicrobiales bacterium]|nr:hypothetical protein [Longimicrobiales bacterium]